MDMTAVLAAKPVVDNGLGAPFPPYVCWQTYSPDSSCKRVTIFFFLGRAMFAEGRNPEHTHHLLHRCGMVVLMVAVAAGVRVWPLEALGPHLAWLTFYPAVMIAAIYGGFLAGLLAAGLSCLVVAFGWPLLVAEPFIQGTAGMLGLAIFLLNSLLVCGVVEALHRARVRAGAAQKEAESLARARAESERFLKSIINAVPNMIGYWDKNLRFRFANEAYQEWHGKRPDAIIGMDVREMMGERLYGMNEPHIRRALAGEPQRFQRMLPKVDGSVGYILANYVPDIDASGEVKGIFIQASDVTELKAAQAQLELAASVYDATIEGIAVTDAQGVFISVNPAFTAITGYTAEEAIGQTPRLLKSNRHDQAFYAAMWKAIATEGRWRGDIWNRRKDGELYLERITITMIGHGQGEVSNYVSVFSDVTDIWQKDEYLRHLASHDALTDLPNRWLLMELLQRRIDVAAREQICLAVMFLDLDGFKQVNDTFGHNIGDDLLKEVGRRLQSLVRQTDVVARLGGDEFVIKLDNPADREEIAVIAKRIVSVINEPMDFGGHVLQVGTSIGIAVFPSDGAAAADLIKSADGAMYAAKAAGKNTFRFSADIPADEGGNPEAEEHP